MTIRLGSHDNLGFRAPLEDAEDGAARYAEAAGEGIDGKALAAPQPYDLLVAPSRPQAAHTAGLVVAAERQGAVEAGGREVAALISILDVLRQGVAPACLAYRRAGRAGRLYPLCLV
jgi:hypothetical protein